MTHADRDRTEPPTVRIPPIPRPCMGCGAPEYARHGDDCPEVIAAVKLAYPDLDPGVALDALAGALDTTPAELAGGEEPHPCGHADRVRGCGGCDPGAVEFVRDDGGPWRAAPVDVEAIAAEWLQQCGPCDFGAPMGCSCPGKDPRPVIARLVEEVERLAGGAPGGIPLHGQPAPRDAAHTVPEDAVRVEVKRLQGLPEYLAEKDAELAQLRADVQRAETAIARVKALHVDDGSGYCAACPACTLWPEDCETRLAAGLA